MLGEVPVLEEPELPVPMDEPELPVLGEAVSVLEPELPVPMEEPELPLGFDVVSVPLLLLLPLCAKAWLAEKTRAAARAKPHPILFITSPCSRVCCMAGCSCRHSLAVVGFE